MSVAIPLSPVERDRGIALLHAPVKQITSAGSKGIIKERSRLKTEAEEFAPIQTAAR